MDRLLREFITVIRYAGVRVSVTESMDALRAVENVGYGSRDLLKDSLSVVLAKSAHEKDLLGNCFDRFFSLAFFENQRRAIKPPIGLFENGDSDLGRRLLSGDQAGLITAMRQAGSDENIQSIRLSTQRTLYARRILERMGIDALDSAIQSQNRLGTASSLQEAARLEDAKRDLMENVRLYVEQQFDLYASRIGDELMEAYLRHAKLSNLEQQHFQKMHALIRKLVKQLNDRQSRRPKTARRGHLDFKRTLRKNVTYEGIIFDPKWKKKKIERPDVVAICDISRSVQRLVRFLLIFLYSLNQEIMHIRTFIFCSDLTEVTPLFEMHTVEEAVERIQHGTGLPILMGRTDYDQSFRDFQDRYLDAVTHRTTVLILGDARNNYGDPQTKVLKMISERCRRLIWLNPEIPPFWGTGDSEMKRYAPYCHLVKECNTLNHLERVVHALLSIH